MSISVHCRACDARFTARTEMAGRRGKCPRCQAPLVVPAAGAAAVQGTSPPATPAKPIAKAIPVVAPAAAHPISAPSNPVEAAAAPGSAARATGKGNRDVERGNRAPTPPRTAPPQARRDVLQLQAELQAAFRGEIEPVELSSGYKLAIMLVSLVMVLLPLVYISLIGLMGWLLYLYAIHGVALLSAAGGRGRAQATAFLLYLAPLLAGGILLVFMIKPLFARPARRESPRSLTPQGEPVLFSFVERVCHAVGAPTPRRIDVDCQVNAAAGFRQGMLSMLDDDLVLTIGLPLVAGLSLQQFAGVLAHEFGHFTQGAGMRLSYVIRSISYWFTRVVYERDEWDQRLVDWSNTDIRLAVIFYLARIFVWLTRKLLWGLMMVGHMVGGFLLRQMEFDADLHEARLAGSTAFETTCRRLTALNVATQGAHADLGEWYRDGRLGDNLPRLIIANLTQIPPEVLAKVNHSIDQSETGVFDTHPADKDRIAAARADAAAGVFHSDRPATVLFSDFDSLAKTVTWDYYKAIFGDDFKVTDMHPVEQLLERQGREIEARKALGRFFLGQFSSLRPLPMSGGWIDTPQDAKACVARVRRNRELMMRQQAAYESAYERFDQADSDLIESDQAAALLQAGFKVRPGDFKQPFTHRESVGLARRKALAAQQSASAAMTPFDEAAAARLMAALELLHLPQLAQRLADAPALADEAQRLISSLSLVCRQLAPLLKLRNHSAALSVLLSRLEGNEQNERLIDAIRDAMKETRQLTLSIHEDLRIGEYPFDHARGDISIAQYCLQQPPGADDLGAIYGAAGALLDHLSTLYIRLVGRLTMIAEQAETALGLPPFPDPPPKPDRQGEPASA